MDWKKVVSGVAPALATALGGPLAGTAVNFIAKELLGDEKATVDQISEAVLSASPETLVRLQEINKSFELHMKGLNVDLEALAVDDRKSARDMAVHADIVNMLPHILLSAVFIGGYFWLLQLLFSGEVQLQENVRDMANILLGVLTAGIPMILRFWFGGSPGDERNMDRIYHAIPGKSS